ncbi:hypothetical protein H5410_034209 [Solanum commersonii]|uniref:Uncharacterized protein n=1 Tax=Solanum commersonii TaxID=4109 RepID=A0A9J5YSS1_SOLCO|nr:hypothetical protein H5410_034209 [Solanum commersonii]
MAKVAELEAANKDKMREKAQKIISHVINCFVNRQLAYNFPEEQFAEAGILVIEHADFDGIERLALVTGGEFASIFDNPESVKLGHCKLIEEIMIDEDNLIYFPGTELGQAWVESEVCLIPCNVFYMNSVSYSFGSLHILAEAERSLHDALCVLSQTTPGKRSHAIEAFSRALVAIRQSLLTVLLRAEHHKEESNAGIDVITGQAGDMAELGISEAFKVKQAVLLSATEAAEMILRLMKSSHMSHGGWKTECKTGLDVLNLLRCLYSIM